MSLAGPPLEEPFRLDNPLCYGLENYPDALALVSRRERWTWRELDEVSDRLARNLLDLGLEPGDCIASLMPNRCELLIHYLACLKAGLVAVPLNYRYTAPEIDHALGLSGAKILFAHDERANDLAASELAGKLPLGVISYDDDSGGSGSPSYAELSRRPTSRALPPHDPDAPMIIFFTSGSTGKPKGVCHSAATLGWVLASLASAIKLTPDDVMLPGSSMSHAGGHWYSLAAFAVGARVVCARTFDADELLHLFREERPTALWMLPSALFALVRDHGARHEDFASLRVCVSGGDKVAAALEKEFTDLVGVPIDEIYGMSEHGCSAFSRPDKAPTIGSCGEVAPGFEVEVRDEDGREVAVGEEGRLWVKFPGLMLGYWDNPKATEETIQDGWLDTGDLMRLDESGRLWFCGRKKQIIVHDGSNISPQEIEEALVAHQSVADAGVVGVWCLLHGENVRAYVTLAGGAARPTDQELIQFARARVGYKAPEEIAILDEMPFNATGKVDRVTLKRRAADESHCEHVDDVHGVAAQAS